MNVRVTQGFNEINSMALFWRNKIELLDYLNQPRKRTTSTAMEKKSATVKTTVGIGLLLLCPGGNDLNTDLVAASEDVLGW